MQGWIIKPPNFDPSKKYAFILDIHGGPHAMYGVGFQHELQIQAAHGYVVLYMNPRGSTGYGEEFGNIIHTHYPGDDFKDLMIGVDKMVEKGYIDPKKLCVTGGSGGGLLTAWAIGHTDRFAAAVSQYPGDRLGHPGRHRRRRLHSLGAMDEDVAVGRSASSSSSIRRFTSRRISRPPPWSSPANRIAERPLRRVRNCTLP